MVEVNNLKLGDMLYKKYDNRAFEVIKESESAFYVAIFDGSSSKIDYISKHSEFNDGFFYTKENAIENMIIEYKRNMDYLETKLKETK